MKFPKKEQMFSLFGIKCGRVFDPKRTTSLFHFARIAGKYLKRLLLSVFCFSHPYNSSQQHQNVCVHIGITRQFHSGRCLMFLVLRLSLSYCYYGDILMHRVFFFQLLLLLLLFEYILRWTDNGRYVNFERSIISFDFSFFFSWRRFAIFFSVKCFFLLYSGYSMIKH